MLNIIINWSTTTILVYYINILIMKMILFIMSDFFNWWMQEIDNRTVISHPSSSYPSTTQSLPITNPVINPIHSVLAPHPPSYYLSLTLPALTIQPPIYFPSPTMSSYLTFTAFTITHPVLIPYSHNFYPSSTQSLPLTHPAFTPHPPALIP